VHRYCLPVEFLPVLASPGGGLRRRLRRWATMVWIAALFCSGTTMASAAVHEVEVRSNLFDPEELQILSGDTVRWVWIEGSHTTTSGSDCVANGTWESTIGPSNRSFEFIFENPGDFPYFCRPHCGMGMTGLITVSDASATPEPSALLGAAIELGAAPNPFVGSTAIGFRLSRSASVHAAVHDAAGRQVALLADGQLEPGAHRVDWNGLDSAGARVPAGVYFLRLAAGPEVSTLPIIRLD